MSAWLNEPKLGSTSWGRRVEQRRRARREAGRGELLLEARLAEADGGNDCERCGLPVCTCEVRP